MEILGVKTLKGPNIWSITYHNLIEATINIGPLEQKPTNEIPGFFDRLVSAIPSLHSHHCSEGHEGGFFERVQRGTWMAHVAEHLAIELQVLAGMDVTFGRTRGSGTRGTYHVAVQYLYPQAGKEALKSALDLSMALIQDQPYDINAAIDRLEKIRERNAPGVSTAAILAEARERNIPYRALNSGSLYILGYGANQRRIEASITCATSGISIDMASDKQYTKALLHRAYIDVPEGETATTVEQLLETIEWLGYPVAIKPLDASQGRGITTNIRTEKDAIAAFGIAQAFSKKVIVERFIEGDDYRLLVVNNKLVAAAKRTPASVTGDGKLTIRQLVEEANRDPRRGNGHANVLTKIDFDAKSEELLARKQLTADSVPERGEIIYLKATANLSTGGTSADVTDIVHPDNIRLAERVSRIINLDVCGIDVVAKDIAQPLRGGNGCIIEVNACPGLRMHMEPTVGIRRNVAEPIVSMLFPEGETSRIPIVAVTGTNGKTTTTRLVAHLAKVAGHNVGYTTTDGIYIDDHAICYGDCTGEASAEAVLSDPLVEFAVLECARGGILRSGLGFDECSTSIVTNVSEDHLGLDGIKTLRDMRRVKAVVAESTMREGYTILNAEDDEVYYMGDYVECNIALFALDPKNDRVRRHCEDNGLAAVIEDEYITVYKGKWKTRLCKVNEVPLSFNGAAKCMIRNILAAVLAGVVHKFDTDKIREALKTFVPSPEKTPGRFNVFEFPDFKVMVDYAHNQAAMRELKTFLDNISSTRKVGIITGVGDRRDSDIRELGKIAADIFDEIIIRHDADLRGRSADEMTNLLTQGIRETDPSMRVRVIPDENSALAYAISNAVAGSFITTLTESVHEVIAFVQHSRDIYEHEQVVAQV